MDSTDITVYTVLNPTFASYFGLTSIETESLLNYYGLKLNESVKQKYDSYRTGNYEIYNPWSIINYAKMKELNNYWINTSINYLIMKHFRKQILLLSKNLFN